MNIRISSRTGHYNLFKPSEESISTNIAIYEGEERLRNINIETEYEVSENDFEPEDVVSFVDDLIERQIKKIWFSSSEEEWREFWGFMLVNKDEIIKGQIEYKIECLKKQTKDCYQKYKSAKHNIGVYKDMLLEVSKEVKMMPKNKHVVYCGDVEALLKEGWNINRIARHYGVKWSTVKRRLDELLVNKTK